MEKIRKCLLTASFHHDIYTKVNSLLRCRKKVIIYSSLVAEIIHPSKDLTTLPAVKWGIVHEDIAYKTFYANEVLKHDDFKLEKCGIFICMQKKAIHWSLTRCCTEVQMSWYQSSGNQMSLQDT